jgi:hypothetical protein
MRPAQPYRVNLGGEGEAAGALNQQGPWVLQSGWASSRTGQTLDQLAAAGHEFLICDNLTIPLPDDCADEVLTNSVPVDTTTWLGPGVQSGEIRRILKSGGVWILNGHTHYTKP